MTDKEAAADPMEQAMVDEFDSVAEWTADAVLQLGADHALPAACRGSGSPKALEWLAQHTHLSAGLRLLDAGAGVGGPAEFARRTSGASPTLAEPMFGACRAASKLFGLPTVVADGSALPFPDSVFDVAWSIGVLCTVSDKATHLGELARVVTREGSLGLLVFERTSRDDFDQPEGNHFPLPEGLTDLLRQADLEVVNTALLDDFGPPPTDWQNAVDQVDALIAEHRGHLPAWRRAQKQQDAIGSLIANGSVIGRLWQCRRATPSRRHPDAALSHAMSGWVTPGLIMRGDARLGTAGGSETLLGGTTLPQADGGISSLAAPGSAEFGEDRGDPVDQLPGEEPDTPDC